MSRQLRIEYPGAFYHITSRGNEQKDIFASPRDREKFLEYLQSATQRYGAIIHAYCLMSNHYHLLMETPGGNLSSIMQHINGAYTTYYNIKKKRSGHLFQGRFKAFLVEADSYLLELSRYMHLNPVRAGIVKMPEQYAWSSYGYYTGHGDPPEWLNTGFVLDALSPQSADKHLEYRLFVESRLRTEYESPLKGAVGGSILGSSTFVEKITATQLRGKEDRNIPALRQFSGRVTPEEIIRETEALFAEDQKLARRASIYLCRQLGDVRLVDLGERFNMRDTAISEAIRRFAVELERDDRLKERLNEIKEKMKNVECRSDP